MIEHGGWEFADVQNPTGAQPGLVYQPLNLERCSQTEHNLEDVSGTSRKSDPIDQEIQKATGLVRHVLSSRQPIKIPTRWGVSDSQVFLYLLEHIIEDAIESRIGFLLCVSKVQKNGLDNSVDRCQPLVSRARSAHH